MIYFFFKKRILPTDFFEKSQNIYFIEVIILNSSYTNQIMNNF